MVWEPDGALLQSTNPFDSETMHTDYWQTWQEGERRDAAGDRQGTFPDLIEDCVFEKGGCAFVTNTVPRAAYKNASQ